MTKKCCSCGAEVPADALFCPSCGSKISLICPQCGRTIENHDAMFCPDCGRRLSDEAEGSSSAGAAAYYCAHGLKRVGPLSAAEVEAKIKAGEFGYGDSVWDGSSTEWTPLEKSAFGELLTKSAPLPMPGANVNNIVAWAIAFSPLIGRILQYFVASAMLGTDNAFILAMNVNRYWFVTVIIILVLAALDIKLLKNAGYDIEKYFWWIFIIPVYLYKRAALLNQNNAYFWVWIACWVISIFL